MAKSAYCSGEQRWSEYEQCWKQPKSDKDRVLLVEVMLPRNAPREYANPEVLWNAVDAAEKSTNAQTARVIEMALPRELTYEENLDLVRDYCQRQFVDKGMICNVHYHDSGDGNPHVHLMLTMRAMDDQGRWLPKSKNVYVLDENGQRIPQKNGGYKRRKICTVDWDNPGNVEMWRHEWETYQNNALEMAGRTERVDMRSLKDQGISDRAPQKHMGPAAAAMERKGIVTEVGEENRKRISINNMIAGIQRSLKAATDWLKSITDVIRGVQTISNPGDYSLVEILFAYKDMRKAERTGWSYYRRDRAEARDLTMTFDTFHFMKAENIRTIGELANRLETVDAKLKGIKTSMQEKQRRINDINAYFEARETVAETKAVAEQYDNLHWKGQREKFFAEHGDEIKKHQKAVWLRDKLIGKLGLPTPVNTETRKALKAEIAQLEKEIGSLRPQLDQFRSEMDQLKKLRYMAQKVFPDALPDPEKNSFENAQETIQNRKELKEDIAAAVDAVTHPPEALMQDETKPISVDDHHQRRYNRTPVNRWHEKPKSHAGDRTGPDKAAVIEQQKREYNRKKQREQDRS